jgi:short-subunit dehydrogenase
MPRQQANVRRMARVPLPPVIRARRTSHVEQLMPQRLQNAVAVITGASSGIGRATALAFADRGSSVVLAARRASALDDVARQCQSRGGQAIAVCTDVTDPVAVEELALQAVKSFGRINVWVNNAAVSLFARFDEAPVEAYRQVIETNLFGTVHGARAALRRFREQRSGVLINVASVAAYVGQPYTSAYVASKFAMRGLAECLRQELRDTPDIHVCTVLPPSVDTPLFQQAANFTGRVIKPMSPVHDAESVAATIVRLAKHPQPEVFIDSVSRLVPLLRALAPKAVERITARKVEQDHFQDAGAPPSPGNLFEPIPDCASVSGGWRKKSDPPGVTKFDSSAAMLRALARYLEGKDFPALGQPRLLQYPVSLANWIPRKARELVFARLGATEGVAPQRIGNVNTAAIAEWATRLYPQRRYPAVMIGSSNGALIHLAAALRVPWLPQTFLTLVHQPGVHPDEPVQAMEAGQNAGHRFLAANPDVQLHHMHDPNQDRLMLAYITYFRWKFRRLPKAYCDFIIRCLEPNGTIIIVECERHWPTTRVDDRYHFQFGALGGPTTDEYFHGGERVEAYLARYRSHRRAWQPPAPDEHKPEAEWGFEPALRGEVVELARARGYRVVVLRFEQPEDLSPPVADFYRGWYRERGLPSNRLLVESFILMEPYETLRLGAVPYWMEFNMEPSLRRIRRYLAETKPFDHIHLMLFAHGVNGVGLPSIQDWRTVLEHAREGGAFVGVDEKAYPAHFAAFGRYHMELRKVPARRPLPDPLTLDPFEHFLKTAGTRYRVRLEGSLRDARITEPLSTHTGPGQ